MAKFIDKILESIKINESDEDYMFDPEDDEFDDTQSLGYEEDTYISEQAPAPAPAPAPAVEQPTRFARKERSNVVPMRSGRGNMEVCMIKPVSVDDGRDICDTILSGRAVVINLEGIHVETAQRIIDFTSGACYSLGGNLQKISNYIFIVTPKAIELSGDFQEVPAEDDMTLSSFGAAF